jgi:hypothetical protein
MQLSGRYGLQVRTRLSNFMKPQLQVRMPEVKFGRRLWKSEFEKN